MAKLFKSSTFLLLAALLLLAEASRRDDKKSHHDDDHDGDQDDDHDDDDGGLGGLSKLKGLIPIRKKNVNVDVGINNGDGGSDGAGGCQCNDDKFRDFVKKLGLLYKGYASEQLAPELKAMASKLIDFTLSYLAKEKPDEVNKVHSFLQTSAKVTSSAVAQAGGVVRA